MSLNRGFTLIEVLIATVILFFSILTVNAAFKQYASYKAKQQKYENIYMTVLSLVDKVENSRLEPYSFYAGEINGLKYTVKVDQISTNRNYVYTANSGKSGNVGSFLLSLYKVEIRVAGKSFTFYQTRYRKIR